MQSRKSSVVSTTSLKHRKFSTTRLQRQAELSLLNEETHASGLGITTKGSNATESFENFSFPSRSPTSTSLARTETGGPSPFDIHPGSRIRGFSCASFSWSPESFSGSFAKPFDEPYNPQSLESGRWFSVVKRTPTGPIDVEHPQEKIQQPAVDARARNVSLHRVYNNACGGRAVKPGGLRELQLETSLATAHANAVLLSESSSLHERQALYVFDFDTSMPNTECFLSDADCLQGNKGLVLRGPPQAFGTIAGLKKYLDTVSHTIGRRFQVLTSQSEPSSTIRIMCVDIHLQISAPLTST